jgi:hypothetical protein
MNKKKKILHRGMSPIRWAMYSSFKQDVLLMIFTNSTAMEGTSEIMIRRKEFANDTSIFSTLNRRVSACDSIISTWIPLLIPKNLFYLI